MTAVERVKRYLQARKDKPLNGLTTTLHAIHTGTQWEAEVTLEDLAELVAVISEGTKWVDTDDRKPKHGETVLGYWPASSNCIASYESLTYEEDEGRDCWMTVFEGPADPPTYWMPLPEAPTK